MINQLRIYRVDPAVKDAVPDRFRDHAAPLMQDHHGFRIVATWLSEGGGQLRFFHVLAW